MQSNSPNRINIEEVLKGQKCYEIVGEILVRQIDNEAILLHISTGTYLSLSETSIPFWEALQNRQPLEPVVSQIINEYEVESSQILDELKIFLEDLIKFGIIRDSLNA